VRLQDLASSKAVIRLGLFLAQHAPPWMGHGLARIAAALIVRCKPGIYRTVRTNLRQIDPQADDAALREMVRQVFCHAVRGHYDFFRAIDGPPETVLEAIRIPVPLLERVRAEMARGRGVLILGTHMSNFDMVILAIGAHRLPAQVLSLAAPRAGFDVLNRLRAEGGVEVTPITSESLRAAIRRLRGGGIVMTGVDWPVPQDRELIEFFGRPAYLPLGPARLALMTDAMVVIGSCRHDPDAGYVLDAAWPVEIARTGDRRQDILANTRRFAAIVEGHVRAHPEQWMMFHPFWPE
jgi:KDO2-lipid IV(A) lauroyltransferase